MARGKVLEIGVGTGANLPFYPDSACLTAVDESVEMLAVAAQRASRLDHCVSFGQTDAEHLAFPAERFDTVVASLLLCSVLDQSRALQEFWRVLRKPGQCGAAPPRRFGRPTGATRGACGRTSWP